MTFSVLGSQEGMGSSLLEHILHSSRFPFLSFQNPDSLYHPPTHPHTHLPMFNLAFSSFRQIAFSIFILPPQRGHRILKDNSASFNYCKTPTQRQAEGWKKRVPIQYQWLLFLIKNDGSSSLGIFRTRSLSYYTENISGADLITNPSVSFSGSVSKGE